MLIITPFHGFSETFAVYQITTANCIVLENYQENDASHWR